MITDLSMKDLDIGTFILLPFILRMVGMEDMVEVMAGIPDTVAVDMAGILDTAVTVEGAMVGMDNILESPGRLISLAIPMVEGRGAIILTLIFIFITPMTKDFVTPVIRSHSVVGEDMGIKQV